MDGEVRITVVATGFTGAASAPLEHEDPGAFLTGPMTEEAISFGHGASRASDDFLEPAIMRRRGTSFGS
jgi:hypothetical protein